MSGSLRSIAAAITPRCASADSKGGVLCPTRAVPLAEAVGAIVAEPVVPYPPGIPVLTPGEIVSPDKVAYLCAVVIEGCTSAVRPTQHCAQCASSMPRACGDAERRPTQTMQQGARVLKRWRSWMMKMSLDPGIRRPSTSPTAVNGVVLSSWVSWSPQEYLADYYRFVEPDEIETIRFIWPASRRLKVPANILVFGCRPTLHHVFPIAPYASEISIWPTTCWELGSNPRMDRTACPVP